MQLSRQSAAFPLLKEAEAYRVAAGQRLDGARQSRLGQFFTPPPVARLMASMFSEPARIVRVLDPGAGTGSLTAALVEKLTSAGSPPDRIEATAFELDTELLSYLRRTYELCRDYCAERDIDFRGTIRNEDFISGVWLAASGSFLAEMEQYDAVIMNPPYGKLGAESRERKLLENAGVRVPNLYAAFVALGSMLLRWGGQLVAITPRSFCNGPYFSSFRRYLLKALKLRRMHVFEARDRAFRDSDVLQENVIFSGLKSTDAPKAVRITSSPGPEDGVLEERQVAYEQVVNSEDPKAFIHLVVDGLGERITHCLSKLRANLPELGLGVSTGRVVEFRSKEHICRKPEQGAAPLIYPCHFDTGSVKWPEEDGSKPNALAVNAETADLLVPEGVYVLVKRFTAKEERRRIVAVVYDPCKAAPGPVGFENHLNFYHIEGHGMPTALAWGLTAYLNSTLVDQYFRLFSGHTQVNATDLRRLPYPTENELNSLGVRLGGTLPDQKAIDDLLREELPYMSDGEKGVDPVLAKEKIQEAQDVLQQLGLPKAQQNERSALTLLALLDLQPDTAWQEARAPLRGITGMMDWFREYYGKHYAPNTRETVRRQTVHQFIQAGIVQKNPDEPDRPTHSPHTVYQVSPGLAELCKYYGTSLWESELEQFLQHSQTLRSRYERHREMRKVPVRINGEEFMLSPGAHSELIGAVLEDFCSRFTPGAEILYVEERGENLGYVNQERLRELGVPFDRHGPMPDVVVYSPQKECLVLVEAVTTHGPVSPTRREQLSQFFGQANVELAYVTAFPSREVMVPYLQSISWETDVWVADSPGHLIHFNGRQLLGAY